MVLPRMLFPVMEIAGPPPGVTLTVLLPMTLKPRSVTRVPGATITFVEPRSENADGLASGPRVEALGSIFALPRIDAEDSFVQPSGSVMLLDPRIETDMGTP